MGIYSGQKWGVHVSGPDSVLAAASFKEAADQCNRINQNMIYLEAEFGESSPLIWAKVELWADVSSCKHEPSKTNWDEIC